MRKLLVTAVLGLCLSANVGCFLPGYSGDPARRTRELIFTSENLRKFNDEWERTWHLDQPDHCSPYRMHGGII